MITADGYFDWMLQAPGVPDKVYSEEGPKLYKVNHSIVGSYEGAIGRLMSTERDASGRYTPYAAASVHYINPKAPMSGFDAVQMYPVTASCWASGTRRANVDGVAGELEGGPPGNTREPMNDHQLAVELRVLRDMRDFFDWPDVRVGIEVREHNEFQATACPSGRYARLYEAIARGDLEEEMGMTDDEKLAMFAGSEQMDARPERDERLAYANARIAEIAEGRASSLQEIAAGGHTHTSSGSGIPDHDHNIGKHRTSGVV